MDTITEDIRRMVERDHIKRFLLAAHIWEVRNAPIVLRSMQPGMSLTDLARLDFNRRWAQVK